MLEVKDLHSYYGKSHILQGVHLNVRQGEIVSLLGRNGVGRSTTIKAIMGQVHVQGKNITLDTALAVGTVPIHPGAVKYYKEKGIAK